MKDPPAEVGENSPECYVYLYRNSKRQPKYVGYGRTPKRAESHLSESHNDPLNAFLADGNYTLEIAGPFGSEELARTIETVLISALDPDYNRSLGPSMWRFRPLGVPTKYADRLCLDALRAEDLLSAQGRSPQPLLLVYISDKNFVDRPGYNPASPPTDEQVLDRVEKRWQLGPHVHLWAAAASKAPAVLVGIHGSPGAQIVIAALHIDPAAWSKPVKDGAYFCIPTRGPKDLDAYALRGRKISREAGIAFGSLPSQFFMLVGADGVARGGHPSRPRIETGG